MAKRNYTKGKDFPKDDRKGGNTSNRRRKSSNRKKDDLKDFSDSGEMVNNSTNDVKWYANNPQLLRDAASYPFSQPVGRAWDTNFIGTTKKRSIPGVIALRTSPAYGWGATIEYNSSTQDITIHGDVKSPVNVAASELYAFIRHANSGAKNYEASDLMMYVAAISNVYSFVTWAMRLYGLARMYDQYNRYMPQTLVELNGVNWGSLQNNLANYRYHLNVLINKVATLYVPATMPIFQRLAFLYQNVYSEGPSTKDQLYMYVPRDFHMFKLDSNGAGSVVFDDALSIPTPSSNSLLTWDQVINIGEKMFQAIWDEEDFATMSGDILKAFGGNVLTLNVMNEDYGLVPVFDEMVLTQIKNATVAGLAQTNSESSGSWETNYWSVGTGLYQESTSQYTSVLAPLAFIQGDTYTTAAQSAGFGASGPEDIANRNQVLTIPSVDPNPGMVIEASRLKFGYNGKATIGSDSTGNKWFYITPTSEVVYEMWVAYNEAGENKFKYLPIRGTTFIHNAATITTLWYVFRYLQMVKSFKYIPELTMVFGADRTSSVASCSEDSLFEVDNYSVIGSSEIVKLNEAALLSLYAVTSIGRNA